MTESAFQEAAQRYREGFAAILAEPELAAALEEDDRGTDVLRWSQDMEAAAGRNLVAGEASVRELAAAQLAAGAALDLAAAADLLRKEGLVEPEPVAAGLEEAPSEFSQTYAALSDVLEVDPVLGAREGLPPPPASAMLSEDSPRDALAGAAAKAVEDISGDAAKIAGHAVDGFRALSLDAIVSAFGQAADQLLGPIIKKARGLVRLAVRHLSKAVSKLLRILGPLEGPARRWLENKLKGITQDVVVQFVVDAILETGEVKRDVAGKIAALPDTTDPEALKDAATEVQSLATRFGRHEKVIGFIAKILEKLRPAILGLVSWAAAALAGVYALVLLYGVWVAGDFLDWRRTREDGALDLVAGVRSVVGALTPPAPPAAPA